MTTYMCFECGFETADRGIFMDTHGDGDHDWTVFICPQCSHLNPRVAEAAPARAPWKPPDWHIDETDHGLCVRVRGTNGCSYSSEMHPLHQLAAAPGWLIGSPERTLWLAHLRLNRSGLKLSASHSGPGLMAGLRTYRLGGVRR